MQQHVEQEYRVDRSDPRRHVGGAEVPRDERELRVAPRVAAHCRRDVLVHQHRAFGAVAAERVERVAAVHRPHRTEVGEAADAEAFKGEVDRLGLAAMQPEGFRPAEREPPETPATVEEASQSRHRQAGEAGAPRAGPRSAHASKRPSPPAT
jgi:hypothetical protein